MASVDGSKSSQISSDENFVYQCNPCDYEGIKKEATFYCSQCTEYLCGSCNVVHHKLASTRKHQVVSGRLMPTKGGNENLEGTQLRVQCSCGGNELTSYCKDHDVALCDDCLLLKHRNCQSSTIQDSSAALETTMTDSTKKRMHMLKEKLVSLKQKQTEDADTLSAQTAECRAAVEKFKQELHAHVDKIAERSLTDISKYDRQQRNDIEQHISTCNRIISKIELDYRPFEEATTSGQKPIIFIREIQLRKTMDDVDRILQEIKDDIKIPNISFHCNETLRMTNIESLGVVKSTPTKGPRHNIVDMDIESVTKIDVKIPSDQKKPWISGSQFMPNNELILCDRSNSAIKVLNADFTQKEQIKISSRPWDCCLMNTEEIVVSLPEAKSLLFVKVLPKLEIGSSISLNQTCHGVAVKDDIIYVSFENGEVRDFDRKGQPQTNNLEKLRFEIPYYTFVTATDLLFVSEYRGGNVRVIKGGKEEARCENIKNPLGFFLDSGENIIICEWETNSLKLINKETRDVRVLLTKDDGLYLPHSVSYRSHDSTIVVGGGHNQNGVIVCKMVERSIK